MRPVSGNAAPFEVPKVEQSQQQQPEKFQVPTTTQDHIVQEMAKLMTEYKTLLHEVNELKTFKETTQKTEEENKTATKRSKIENVIPASLRGFHRRENESDRGFDENARWRRT